MDRRSFLKTAGLGSLALASFPALHDALSGRALAAAKSGYYLVALSQAATIDKVQHFGVVSGAGSFTASEVDGGGSFLHFDNAPPAPKPVIGAGTWVARRLVNFAPLGVATSLMAGILEMEVELLREVPSPAAFPAKLKIVCNIGPAGLQTGQPEGFFLTIPGSPFVEGGAGGPFKPLHPEVGLTAFSPGVETAAFSTAWEQDFQRLHGRAPTPQDRADRIWSLDFAARNGRSPSDAEWYAHWWETQGR